MKTVTAVLALLVLCRPGAAQTQAHQAIPAPELAPAVRMYVPQNLTPERAQKVANFVQSVLNLRVYWDDVPRAIVLRNGNPQSMDAAEELLKRFDVPETKTSTPQIDCTVYLIRASSTAVGPAPAPASAATRPVPPELQSAIDEMKRTFGYDRYALWDAIFLQPRGSGEMQGILPTEAGSSPYVYTVGYADSIPSERNLFLDRFQFTVRIPYGKEGIDSHIKTNITIHEGQKLVLGKIRLLPEEHADLFLVLATKVH